MVDSLDKAPCQRIFSRQERARMQQLHNRVIRWAVDNLDSEKRLQFVTALDAKHYDDAHGILMEVFHSHKRVTIWWLWRWDKWLENFGMGFVPI
jgi:hypothetical protein